MTDDRIGNWLRETRERQRVPGTRKRWPQDYLLDRMREEIGWAPHRPNYSRYETSKSHPEPDTLDKFIAFWTGRGEPGPDLSPEPTTATETPDPTQALISAMTQALIAQTQTLMDVRSELAEIRATMADARAGALQEREVMTKALADLGDQLEALLARGGTGAPAADPGSDHR